MPVKSLLVILSAAVVAGLSVYLVFCRWFQVMGSTVHMQIDTLVWLFAALAIAAAGMTLLLRTALLRSDRTVLARLAELEKRSA